MKVHFIAIGGSIMHQLAVALHIGGHIISGSDDDIFEPSRSNLQKYGLLPPENGWFAEKITPDIDAVILGMHAKPNNPELLAAQHLGIPVYSYPEYIYAQSINKKRVVVSGSFGKTSITSMLMHVLQSCGLDFDYLVGAKIEGFDYSLRLSNAPLIILEGDEYLASPIHRLPKIHYYKPHIAVMTGIDWDHVNVFPTFAEYIAQFEQFVSEMPSGGTFIFNKNDERVKNIAQKATHLHTIGYGTPAHQRTNGVYCLTPPLLQPVLLKIFGQHNLENIEAARLVCKELGIADSDFYTAISSFKGAARRLELVADNGDCTIYKDFAHAPSKVRATTRAVKQLWPQKRLIACFELHTYSSLSADFLPQYKDTLADADVALVFYNAHTFAIKQMQPLQPDVVRAAFGEKQPEVFEHNEALLARLAAEDYRQTNLLLMSSGNFGGLDIAQLAAEICPNKPA